MNGTPYQPAPEGIWRESGQRVLLWALNGVLHQIEREMPEQKSKLRWQSKLERLIVKPVKAYPWSTLHGTFGITRDDDPSRPPAPEVPSKITDAWASIPSVISAELWLEAAEERADRLHLPFDREDVEAAMRASMDLVSSIPEQLHDRLREIMAQTYDEQKGQFAFARQIRDEFAPIAKWKAEQIAVTEWNRAASTATLLGYTKQGVKMKVWYTVGDNRVCELCEANAADGEIPIGETFFTGDAAPPAHPSCRCDIASA